MRPLGEHEKGFGSQIFYTQVLYGHLNSLGRRAQAIGAAIFIL